MSAPPKEASLCTDQPCDLDKPAWPLASQGTVPPSHLTDPASLWADTAKCFRGRVTARGHPLTPLPRGGIAIRTRFTTHRPCSSLRVGPSLSLCHR